MRAGLVVFLIVLVVAIVAALQSFFIVTPRQQALVLQFGEVRQAVREPGLNTKIPFIQDTLFLDKRVLDLNVPAQEIIAADQKRLVVDAFMRYRIANPVRFYQSVNNVREGASRLSTFVQASLRAVLADATFTDIVRDDRPELMLRIKRDVAARARDIGVDIIDVKIRRADLPEANSEAIYRRMQTEREQEAREIRAQGEEAARRITAAADRTATVLRAEADREAEQIRGEGDGRKNAIFAQAYSADPQFFAFYRAMQAYEEGLQSQDTRLVLSPDADFFRYFNDPLGQSTASGSAVQGAFRSEQRPPFDPASTPEGEPETSQAPDASSDPGAAAAALGEPPAPTPASAEGEPIEPVSGEADVILIEPASQPGSDADAEPDAGIADEGEQDTSADDSPADDAAAQDRRAALTDAEAGSPQETMQNGLTEGEPEADADAALTEGETSPAETSTEAAVETAEPATSVEADAVAGTEESAAVEDGGEADLAATADADAPDETSTEAAVETADPATSPAADAAANADVDGAAEPEVAATDAVDAEPAAADGADADADAAVSEMQRGKVTIVRPEDRVE